MAQSQVSSEDRILFNVQMQFNGVLQQLERLERVESGVDRPSKLKRNPEGDSNHVTVQDNLEALITKLMALSGSLNYYKGQFGEGCVTQLVQWYEERQVQSSPVVKKAVADTLDACLGQFTYSPPSVNVDEASLQEYSTKLAEAVNKFHSKEARFDKDPKAFESKQLYPLTHYKAIDVEGFREQLLSEHSGASDSGRNQLANPDPTSKQIDSDPSSQTEDIGCLCGCFSALCQWLNTFKAGK